MKLTTYDSLKSDHFGPWLVRSTVNTSNAELWLPLTAIDKLAISTIHCRNMARLKLPSDQTLTVL